MVMRDMFLGLGVGAILAFVADPRAGRRRRALARDQFIRASRKTREAVDAAARDLSNRTTGMVAAARGRWRDDPIGDRQLIARVRAQLGRACSHPHAIEVTADNGTVTLRGPILTREIDDVVAGIGRVGGVAAVANELEAHESADGIPALQGEGGIAEPSRDILQRSWAPATRALVTAGLAAAGIYFASHARRRPAA